MVLLSQSFFSRFCLFQSNFVLENNPVFSWIYYKIYYVYLPIVCLVYIQIHIKISATLSNCNNFLSFKETLRPYLLKISITNQKNWITLLYLIINCIFSRSAILMSFLKYENTLHVFFTFLKVSSNWFVY